MSLGSVGSAVTIPDDPSLSARSLDSGRGEEDRMEATVGLSVTPSRDNQGGGNEPDPFEVRHGGQVKDRPNWVKFSGYRLLLDGETGGGGAPPQAARHLSPHPHQIFLWTDTFS